MCQGNCLKVSTVTGLLNNHLCNRLVNYCNYASIEVKKHQMLIQRSRGERFTKNGKLKMNSCFAEHNTGLHTLLGVYCLVLNTILKPNEYQDTGSIRYTMT